MPSISSICSTLTNWVTAVIPVTGPETLARQIALVGDLFDRDTP
jgi:hypothetical protein